MTLTACPFCNAADNDTVVINELGRHYRVYCHGCGSAGPVGDTEDHAAELWNASGTQRSQAFTKAAELVRSEITRVQDLCRFPQSTDAATERLRFAVLGRVDGLVMLEQTMLKKAQG
jgi:hypothetical protein